MKKVLKGLIVCFMLLIFCGNCISILRGFSEEEKKEQTVILEKNIYTIQYVGIIDGKEVEIPWVLSYKVDLPKTYIAGGQISIGDLSKDNAGDYEFKGWYRDKELTQPFGGYIAYNEKGNVVLYADIEKFTWSGNYT